MSDLRKIVAHKVLEPFKVWLAFDDGVEGVADLSEFAAIPAFSDWREQDFFKQMKVEGGRHVYWSDDLDLCPDALYIQITGHNPYA